MIKYLNKDLDFNEYINKELVLVDFYADWCGPCKMLGNILEQIEFVDILKINVDEYSDLAQKYGVMSIPTLCFFSKGKLQKKEIGFRNINEIEELVNEIKKEIE